MSADPNSILLNQINEKLYLIIKKLNMVSDIQITITNFDASQLDLDFDVLYSRTKESLG
jgi:hypothetical protein